MLDYLYEWIRQIAYYMVLVTAVMQMAAGSSYRKYIRLFTGMILVLMILAPVLRIFRIQEQDAVLWAGEEYKTAIERMEEKVQEMEQKTLSEIEAGMNLEGEPAARATGQELEEGQDREMGRIEVEEIQIGR